MDAAKIRRQKGTQLANTPIAELAIELEQGQTYADLTTSEPNPPSTDYKLVDERAFTSQAIHTANGWAKRTHEELIDFCKDLELKSNMSTEDMMRSFIQDLDEEVEQKDKFKRERDEAIATSDRLQTDLERVEAGRDDYKESFEQATDERNAVEESARYRERELYQELDEAHAEIDRLRAVVGRLRMRLPDANSSGHDMEYVLSESLGLRDL